jgi:hypothetical protein
MVKLNELDLVALRQPLPECALEPGDVGTVVFVYRDGEAYEVEFVAADGKTIAVETLRADQVEPFAGQQILHARNLQPTGRS